LAGDTFIGGRENAETRASGG
jgi:hypothetical protein